MNTAHPAGLLWKKALWLPSRLGPAPAPEPVPAEVTLGDFFKHGFFILLISFLVLWVWAILGY